MRLCQLSHYRMLSYYFRYNVVSFRLFYACSITITVSNSRYGAFLKVMRKKGRVASKRRIPKNPGKSRCNFTFEVDGETVIMNVDCLTSCRENDVRKDICWSNLVRAISESATPDRIILRGKLTLVCDRILVALLRNAALLTRRIGFRIEELKKANRLESSDDLRRLIDLMRAILYDVPQLIDREFKPRSGNIISNEVLSEATSGDDFSLGREILCRKQNTDFSTASTSIMDRGSGVEKAIN